MVILIKSSGFQTYYDHGQTSKSDFHFLALEFIKAITTYLSMLLKNDYLPTNRTRYLSTTWYPGRRPCIWRMICQKRRTKYFLMPYRRTLLSQGTRVGPTAFTSFSSFHIS